MNNKNSLCMCMYAFVLCIMLFPSGCLGYEETSMDLKPKVRVTSNNYNESTIFSTFWTPPIWENFTEHYNSRYSATLRNKVINEMKIQASSLDLDDKVLGNCIDATGEISRRRVSIPCLAEKAKFNDTDVWIIVFAWGLDKDDLGHIRFYAVDCISFEILHFVTCK